MALTKKKKLTVKMPARPFLGESQELNEKVSALQENQIRKILDL